MRISLIVAMDRKGVIGRGGALPWRLSADLKRFKALTMGHHVIMGRKTFESLGRPLPGRTMVVMSRGSGVGIRESGVATEPILRSQASSFRPQGAIHAAVVHSLEESLRLAADDSEAFIIGGAEVFALALPRVERMYVTWVEADVEGDVTFPQIDWRQWRQISSERVAADEKNQFATTFCVYERI